jgi:hypothetical protein
MRIREPKSTALIFHSGKMVCTGTKSEQEARTASRKYAKILQKLSYAVSFKVGGWVAVVGAGGLLGDCGLVWQPCRTSALGSALGDDDQTSGGAGALLALLGTRSHPPTTCLALTLSSHHLPPFSTCLCLRAGVQDPKHGGQL